MFPSQKETWYYPAGASFSDRQFSDRLQQFYERQTAACFRKKLITKHGHLPVHFLCIGSDRVTGDCLGPLIGYKLSHYLPPGSVIGTLEHPVHALNLAAVLEMLATDDCGFYVAVDASLGDAHHIGCITLSPGAMQPGLGVRKDLPLVGHVSVTGIVGTLSDSGDALLQGTRLSLVMTLADSITQGLLRYYSLCTP